MLSARSKSSYLSMSPNAFAPRALTSSSDRSSPVGVCGRLNWCSVQLNDKRGDYRVFLDYHIVMSMVSDEGVCLRIHEYSETSQIATIFTRGRGLVKVIAKGAHRMTKAGAGKFDGGLDLLDEAAMVVSDRLEANLLILAEWKVIQGRRELRGNLRGMYLGMYAAELLANLFEVHDPQAELYERFRWHLDQLCTEAREEATVLMVLEAIKSAGFLPSLTHCAACTMPMGGESAVYFSVRAGGAICRNCEMITADRVPIDRRLLGTLVVMMRAGRDDGSLLKLPRVPRGVADSVHALLMAHVEGTLGKVLRMRRYVLPSRSRALR
jgi:DNA repair protein RecO (recombination protein O)